VSHADLLTKLGLLEPHLPVGICPKRTFGNMLDCRSADEAAYQTVLDIAKKHCSSLVPEIEKQKRLSEAR
jgi:hypothetical protein